MHSLYSDGQFPPEKLVEMASEYKLRYIALTDHDTIAGVLPYQKAVKMHNEKCKSEETITAITGVEISAGDGGKVHILGYGNFSKSADFQEFLNENAIDRKYRDEQMIAKLNQHGMPLPEATIKSLSLLQSVGRPHIANAMVEQGYVNTKQEAFEKWLLPGKPIYQPRRTIAPKEAIEQISKAGGIAVLAHPCRLNYEDTALQMFVKSLTDVGLHGIEIYHPSTKKEKLYMLKQMAKQYNLCVTGGSDFHEKPSKLGEIGIYWQSQKEDFTVFQNIYSSNKG